MRMTRKQIQRNLDAACDYKDKLSAINEGLEKAIQRLETEKAYLQGIISGFSDELKTVDAENQRLKKIVDQWIEVPQ